MSSTCGKANFSKLAAYGIGTSFPVTLVTGASSQSKAFSVIKAEISAPIPEKGKPSSQVTTLFAVSYTHLTLPTILPV